MSRTKLLLDVAVGLRGLADSVAAVAQAMMEGEPPQPVAESASEHSAPTVTLEQVRAVLADVSRAGKTEAVRELLARFGADRLSAVDPTRYPELLCAAEAL